MSKYLRLLLIGLVSGYLFIGCAAKDTGTGENQEQLDRMSEGGEANSEDGVDARIDGVNGQDGSADNELNRINELQVALGAVYFDFDIFSVKSNMEDVVEDNADKLKTDAYANTNIKLEGNCDEWGTDEYNYALGLKRAKSVKDYLVSEGVSTDRISIISFGESNPTCNDKNKACWNQNRRVETKLLP